MSIKLDESLKILEEIIRDLRLKLQSQELKVDVIDQLRLQTESLFSIFSELETEHELSHNHQVLSIIAKFINQEIDHQNSSFETCFLATCSLCGEDDPRITNTVKKQPKPEDIEEILGIAKEQILMIKVHYESFSEGSHCKRNIEIFSIRPGTDKPRVTRIEEDVYWETLIADIRDSFLRDGKPRVSYQIYPL